MSKRPKAPAFQFYPDSWLSSTSISLMTPAEEGAYIRLLCHCWMNPNGLRADDSSLALLSRLGRAWTKSKMIILPKFEIRDGLLFHHRLEEERAKQAEWKAKSSVGGKQSATKRQPNGNHRSDLVDENGQPKGNTLVSSLKSPDSKTTTSSVRTQSPAAHAINATPSEDGAEATIGRWLSQYVRYFNLDWGAPPIGLCFKVLQALNGASLDELEVFLRDLYKKKQCPSKSYAWFVTVIQEHFEGRHAA